MKWREKSSARIEKASACPAITVQRENSRRIRRRKVYGFDSSRKNADGDLIAKRDYGYDALDRVISRVQTRGNGESAMTRTDAFGCNSRSELTSATLGNAAYAYAFDYIGNRDSASEAGTQLAYAANALNQYATITETEAFTLTYDADGNATLIKTATGTWSVSCNGENRPVRFENAGTQTVVECEYDSLGRRFEKKVTVAGTLVLHERYAYRGYLQIAAFDVAGTQTPTLKRVIYWDPTEETATRPLALNVLGDQVYFPTVDLTKNVCELVDFYGNTAATYDYAPFGAVTTGTPSGSAVPANPFRFSSEFYDSELDLVYYNYRHYSPADGRWLSRDSIEEQGGWNLYAFVANRPINGMDFNGEEGIFRDWLYGACCNGKKYYTDKQCCVNRAGKKSLWGGEGFYLLDRKELSTKFTRKDVYGRMGISWLLQHSWIEYPGGSAGFYPGDDKSKFIYKGEVKIPEPFSDPEGKYDVKASPVVLNQCDYDIEVFEGCLSKEIVKQQGDPDIYALPVNNCQQWREGLISMCKAKAERGK